MGDLLVVPPFRPLQSTDLHKAGSVTTKGNEIKGWVMGGLVGWNKLVWNEGERATRKHETGVIFHDWGGLEVEVA